MQPESAGPPEDDKNLVVFVIRKEAACDECGGTAYFRSDASARKQKSRCAWSAPISITWNIFRAAMPP